MGGDILFADNELVVSTDDQFLFAADVGSSDVAVFRIDESRGGAD